MSEQKLEAYFFSVLFIGIAILVGILFYPFVGALALALVLAVLAMPVYDWLNTRLNRPNVSALAVVLLVTLLVFLPAIGLLVLLVDEAASIAQSAASFDFDHLSHVVSDNVLAVLEKFPALGTFDLSVLVQRAMQAVGSGAAVVVTQTLQTILMVFITLISLFFFIRDGHVFVANIVKLSPLTDDDDMMIVHKLSVVTHSLIRGTMVIAVLQGCLTGLGFLLFGIPNPVLWGSVAAVAALVPSLGTGVVALPAILYLVLTGHMAAAIGYAAWSVLLVGLVDNMLAPKLIGQRARIHPLFVLLSVLGGMSVFGLSGFLLGPLIFGMLVALSEIYKVKIQEIHNATIS